ncbi:dihydrofolate reductase [Gordonia amicalis]|uniref:dihydrofolate reductase n=1 Tax=Gordonia amicalis TaxID=89053 RepID=UPI00374F72CF
MESAESEVYVIGAMARGRVAGISNGAMPWHIPADLRRFKSLTQGHTVIMGRRTWETLGRPLPNRQNIVLTSSQVDDPGVDCAPSLDAALRKSNLPAPAFVIGGTRPWTDALPIASRIYLSYVDGEFSGDVLFPEIDPDHWLLNGSERCVTEVDGHQGVVYFRDYRRRL